MKQILKYVAAVALMVLVFSSCRKDLGNYSYAEINDVVIENFESNYVGYLGQDFKIEPKLKMLDGTAFKPENYTFEWFSYDSTATINSNVKKVLSTEQNLNIKLALPPARYAIYYRITDINTGKFWEVKSGLKISSTIADGWLILNNIDDKARLDILAYDKNTKSYIDYFDITGSASDLKMTGKPLMVHYVKNNDYLTSQASSRIYVSTDKATYSINNQIFTWGNYRNFKSEVMRPTSEDYHAVKFESISYTSYMFDSEGVLGFESIPQAILYGPVLNRLNLGSTIKIAPYLAYSKKIGTNFLVVFDTENQRLLIHKGLSSSMIVPTSSNPEAFKPEKLGKDLVYLAYVPISNSQFYTILKDPATKKISIIRFVDNDTEFVLLGNDEIDPSTHMDKATSFAIDPTFGYIMYTVGNKVYQYDPFNKVAKVLLDFGSREISLIKFYSMTTMSLDTRYLDFAKKLMVGTYDPAQPNTSGKLDFYEISLSAAPKPAESYSGFGKIVDVAYRE